MGIASYKPITKWTARRKQAIAEAFVAGELDAATIERLHCVPLEELMLWVERNGDGGSEGRKRLKATYRGRSPMKLAILAAVLMLAADAAYAAPITGEISINGEDVFTSSVITFSSPGNVGGTAGSYTEIGNCDDCVTMVASLTGGQSSGTLFSATNHGDTAVVSLAGPADYIFTPNANSALDAVEVTGAASLTLTGFDPTPGSYVVTTQGPQGAAVTFSASAVPTPIAAVPAPAIGETLPVGILLMIALLLYELSMRWRDR